MLITNEYALKLTDFGEARATDLDLTMTSVGTPIYVAPEIVMGDRYDFKVDTYSFAIVLVAACRFDLHVPKFFLDALNKDMELQKLPRGGIGTLNKRMALNGFRPHLHCTVYPSMRKLIQDCWKNDPAERPTFDEIIKRMEVTIIEEIFILDEPDFTIDDNHEEDNLGTTNAGSNRLNRFDPIDAKSLEAEVKSLKQKIEGDKSLKQQLASNIAEVKSLKQLVLQYEDELELKDIQLLKRKEGTGDLWGEGATCYDEEVNNLGDSRHDRQLEIIELSKRGGKGKGTVAMLPNSPNSVSSNQEKLN